jgi:addiction module HigA family antidote
MAAETTMIPESDLAIPPGEFLAEELETRGMTQLDLARRMGRPPQLVSGIVQGHKAITAVTALELADVLGLSAQFWQRLEEDYRLALARATKQEAVERDKQRLSEFPVKKMQDLGWLPAETGRAERVSMLRQYFAVAALDHVSSTPAMAAFRATGKPARNRGALAAWLRRGELLAEQESAPGPFSVSQFRTALTETRRLTAAPPQEAVPAVRDLWRHAGVQLLFVPELPGVGVNGCTRWLPSGHALVQVNLRWKWADILWFTLFHEAHHVLRHRLKKVYAKGFDDEDEEAAELYARDRLIAPGAWRMFVESAGLFTAPVVQEFAESEGISPGIVVGRLQYEKLIARSSLNDLRARWDWSS